MSAAVIDTSVVMCVLLNEPGLEKALQMSTGAYISNVNVAEVVAKCVEKNVSYDLAILLLRDRDVGLVEFDLDSATLAGRLWNRAPKGVLSLGDRACIATAIRMNATAVTADRVWSTLDLPCPVELIR